MKILTFLLVFSISGTVFAGQKPTPTPVSVYCTSADLEAGFQDKTADWLCREIGKRGIKKHTLVFADSREEATVIVELVERNQIRKPGDTTLYSGGIAHRPERIESTIEADLTIGDFVKRFSGGTPGTAGRIEKWIRDNREVILQKASKQ